MRARSFFSLCAALALFAHPGFAQELRVALDQAAALRLTQPAAGVAVGNPTIAGVSVQNDRLLFVTGRAYGTTNLVVVGQDGRVLLNGRVTVAPDEANAVMVTRGAETERLECTPVCRPRPDIGSARDAFSEVNGQIDARSSQARQR